MDTTACLEAARSALEEGQYTCVLNMEGELFTSRDRGVAPLIRFIDSGRSFRGACAADRVVGRAAAFLYVILGVSRLHAGVLSRTAQEVLLRFGIPASCDSLTDTIFNRSMTGLCPMESTVLSIDSPEEALAALRKKLAELRSGQQS